MKSISKKFPHFIFVMMLSVASVATASSTGADKDIGEAARITQALELYAQAVPMDFASTQRTELLKRAETILTDVIDKNPQSLEAHRKLMGVYLQMRDYRKAILTMQDAISLSPDDPKLYIALAILYDHSGAYEYALPILDQALKLESNNKLAQEYRLSIQLKIEEQRLAMESSSPPHKAAVPHSK
ncbi:MAG: tetratricopeptide repeat protein [Gammaproteobacteria bacterium]|nr:tetratricopeptide repeat protein [Gammaproteobacteria bacterium]